MVNGAGPIRVSVVFACISMLFALQEAPEKVYFMRGQESLPPKSGKAVVGRQRRKKRMIKAVIFDMFETLVDLFEGRTYFSENIASDMNLPVDTFRMAWHATESFRSNGQFTIEDAVTKTLTAFGCGSAENVELVCRKRREALEDTFRSVPEAVGALLQELHERDIRIGVISNCYSDECKAIHECSIYPLLDAAKLSYEQGICKPDVSLYFRAAAELGVEPEECLYVGDGGCNELQAAKEAGMKPVQALWFREKFFEPHVPSPVFEEFDRAEKPQDVLRYL